MLKFYSKESVVILETGRKQVIGKTIMSELSQSV